MKKPVISFEFFPPRSPAQQRKFWYTLGCLQTLNPSYISVTWGALGSAAQASLDVLADLVKDCKVPITAHLSCAGQTERQMLAAIEELESLGITRFLALRGDIPDQVQPADKENSSIVTGETVLTHASDLVRLLAINPRREISVAAYPEAHPESLDLSSDIGWLKHKLDLGASQAITQFFFNADTFLRFRDTAVATGISQKLVPGILPIHNIDKVLDFSAKCGATVSRQLVQRFQSATTAESKQRAAIEHCVELCQELHREGVDDFHLYTLNQAPLAYAVACELLGKPVKVADMQAA